MNRIAYIDFAKGYAIFTILCYHALQRVELPELIRKAIVFGGTGVHLFFLLSGLGLMLAQPLPALAFYRRRMSKVWLPYVLAVSVSLFFAVCCGLFPDGWAAWAAAVGLYQMFSAAYMESFGGHFWFIGAIFQFYIVFPVLHGLFFRCKNARWFFAGALTVSIAWWWLVWALGKGDLRHWNSCFLQFLWEFALGMAIGGAVLSGKTPSLLKSGEGEIARGKALLLSGTAAAVFTGIMVLLILRFGEAGRTFNDIPALIGYTALSYFIFRWSSVFRRFFTWIGGFSFSLYLIHILVLEIFIRGLSHSGVPFSLFFIPIYLLVSLGAGQLFERLSRKWVSLWETAV